MPESGAITGNPARVHDFRHGYAVHRLNQWVKEGHDLNALYPYLSEYMGHSNYADTDYYLSLVEEFYPEMEQRLSSVNDDILPEAVSYTHLDVYKRQDTFISRIPLSGNTSIPGWTSGAIFMMPVSSGMMKH